MQFKPFFTSTFHYPGSNGWYGSGSYSASTEQLGGGHKTAFVDAASVFSAAISGTMYKPGGTAGSLVNWSVTGNGGSAASYYLPPMTTAYLPVGGGQSRQFTYLFNGSPALGGYWVYSGFGVDGSTFGKSWTPAASGSSNTYSFPPGVLPAGQYNVHAARNTQGAREVSSSPIYLVGVKQVNAAYGDTTVTSTTESPGDAETIYIPVGESVTLTATPEPGSTWPSGNPTWQVDGNAAGSVSGSFTFTPATYGIYTVSVHCGTSSRALKVVAYTIESITVAETPLPRSRKTLSLNEEVLIYALPSEIFSSEKWSISGGSLSHSFFTAPSIPGNVTLTINVTPIIEIIFTVKAPSGAKFSRLNDRIFHINNMASAGFRAKIHITPADVSFYNVSFREEACPAQVQGCFVGRGYADHPTGEWMSAINVEDIIVDELGTIVGIDTVQTNCSAPYGDGGTFIWDIPYEYSTGNIIKQFATVRHRADVNGSGDMTLSKGNLEIFCRYDDPSSDF